MKNEIVRNCTYCKKLTVLRSGDGSIISFSCNREIECDFLTERLKNPNILKAIYTEKDLK